MLEWVTPAIQDEKWITQIVDKAEAMGSDVSFANLYLLRDKYDIQIARYRDFLIRHYNGYFGRAGYTFPLGKVSKGSQDIVKALEEIEADAIRRCEKLQFTLLTQEQKDILEECMPERFEFSCNPGDSDYIYLQEELATLPGKAFHKKKNHVSKFKRTYPDYEFREIGQCCIDDAALIEDAWYNEHLQEEDDSALKEYRSIKDALEHFESLNLSGGILYVNNVPAAMSIASHISGRVCDVHYEKAIGEYAVNGAYAMINKLFSESLSEYEYINREEDIGIEGLRKAKMSYRPKLILKKYNAIEK